MTQRDTGFVALLVLALAGLVVTPFAATREPAPEGDTGAARAAGAAKGAEPARDAAGPLLADFLLPGERRETVTTAQAVDALRARGIVVRSLIVAIPDPVDSILDYAFDRSLDALQRAARADGYLLDRYFLPWVAGARGDAASDTDGPAAAGRPPGVLLFRKVTSSAGAGGGPRLELLASSWSARPRSPASRSPRSRAP